MDLDKKQALLVAMYAEYQKDFPNMWNVLEEYSKVTTDIDLFYMTLKKLDNEELVAGVSWERCIGEKFPGQPYFEEAMITSKGIDYVENKLEISSDLTSFEKTKSILEKATEWGWDQIKDICARIISDNMK